MNDNSLYEILKSIANAIRSKKKKENQINPQMFSSEVFTIAGEYLTGNMSDGNGRGKINFEELVIDGTKVHTIKNGAFKGLADLREAEIQEGVLSIESDGFAECTSLAVCDLPNGITSIAADAFSGCISLTNILIPSSVTSIGSNAFRACSGIESIIVNAANENYTSRECNVIIDSNDAIVLGCKNSTIPNGSLKILNRAFDSIPIDNVTIPNTITEIGAYAFTKSGLTTITFNEGSNLEVIGESAFNQSRLTSIQIPPNVLSIGSLAFFYCGAFKICDCTKCQNIPTLMNVNAFSGTPSDMKIIVADDKYDGFINADAQTSSNWIVFGPTGSNQIIKESDYNATLNQ